MVPLSSFGLLRDSTTVHILVLTVHVEIEHGPDREDQETAHWCPFWFWLHKQGSDRAEIMHSVRPENGLFPFGAELEQPYRSAALLGTRDGVSLLIVQ